MTTTNVLDLPGVRPVHRIGFGAMQLAGPGVLGPPTDPARAEAVLRRAVELGIDHIDTSDFYGPWVVNELIAKTLRPYPEGLVLATKVGAYRDHHGGFAPLGHPDALKSQVHDNLRRLRLETLDVVYLRHTVDRPGITLEDQLGALVELREEGLLRGIGLSNVTPEQFEQAQAVTPIVSVQNAYNVFDRGAAALLDRTAELGVPFVPFFPLGSAFVADSRVRGDQVVRSVAQRRDVTPAQVSLAWLLRRSPNLLLIPGTSSIEHLEANSSADRVELTDTDVAALDDLVPEGAALERAQ
ncbi:oxidoreductase [Saccharopolyspora sp. NFXS83]|uniref:oxidoreductase n=1 Tax=Saccharopolyspora sp. NFXS83 TaxID=2993560 RepID=UPI00224B6992|nr:oxidoreductase [Saccharopolyspora sp. NFXS83]MCX2729913.1 oxidoreductase [Saccharopolyspora sp. NFXS83]